MNAWEIFVQQPVINVLIVMSDYLGGSFGLAIISLTILINVLILPLNLKQMRATKAMQMLQPKLAELQKKYGKDRQRMAQEQMRLYKESGMNPAGCLVPMLVQMPIWIALYQSIMMSLAVAPESLLNLSRYLYSWPIVFATLPLGKDFLGMNLASPNTFLAILVGASMWLQQKMSMTSGGDSKMQSQARMMLWMMPMMFTFLALSFPSGLALFWVASSVVRIVIQYKVTGWGGLVTAGDRKPVAKDKRYMKYITRAEEKSAVDVGADIVETSSESEGIDRGPSSITKPSKMRYQPGKDRAQQRKKK